MIPGIRVRDLRTGQAVILPAGTTVEILDERNDIGLLLMPDPVEGSLHLVTAEEEPEIAARYAMAHGLKFSAILKPDISLLQPRASA